MAVVVSVVWYRVFPAVFGGQKGIAEFNAHLSKHHSLICLCSSDNDTSGLSYPALPLLSGGRTGFLRPSDWFSIHRTIRRENATHLLVEHAYFGPAGIFIRMLTGVKVVVHAHNIESNVFRDNGRTGWRALRLLERFVYGRADLVLFKTEADRRMAVEQWGVDRRKTHVVPFGISRRRSPTEEERGQASKRIRDRYHIPSDCRILYFCGTLDYEPNARALEWMVRELLPELRRQGHDGFRLIVTGRVRKPKYAWLESLRDADYHFGGETDEVSDLMAGCNLFVNPVDTGGGIKVKNMEALSFGTTVVTTGHSATGIDRELTGDKLVIVERNDVSSFARAVAGNWDRRDPTPAAFFEQAHWEGIVAEASGRIGTC